MANDEPYVRVEIEDAHGLFVDYIMDLLQEALVANEDTADFIMRPGSKNVLLYVDIEDQKLYQITIQEVKVAQ